MAKKKKRHAPPGWEEERKQRLRQQRRQKALREASKRAPHPVTVTQRDGVVRVQSGRNHTAAYERYIQSERWARRKVEYYFKFGKQCWRCGTTMNIHLHHHTYLRLGNELNEDLVPLCQTCHGRAHQIHRTGNVGDLTAATVAAIQEHPSHLKREVVLVPKHSFGKSRWMLKDVPPSGAMEVTVGPMKITFACKDLVLASHCQRIFGDEFLQQLSQADPGQWGSLFEEWDHLLTAEASRQQWWDYYTDHGDRRFVIRDDEGHPALLIPQVLVSD